MSTVSVPKGKVAVIGLGVTGLGALKNLLEQGFDAVGIERNSYVGGLWQWTENKEQVSVLKTTVSLGSKQGGSYSDFPFPKEYPDNPTAPQFAQYLNSYAHEFNLFPRCRFGVKVRRIQRSDDGQGWELVTDSKTVKEDNTITTFDEKERTRVERFDRVLICTGPWTAPFDPSYPGQDTFKGQTLLSREYKDPEDFAGKRVAIIGMGITGCEDAVSLVGHAAQVYISHRTGVRIMRRDNDGKPADHFLTRRRTAIAGLLRNLCPPALTNYLGARFLESRMKKQFPNIKPEWGLLPAPPVRNSPVTVNDTIIDRLADGSIISLGGIQRFYEGGIETKEGKIAVDTVIFCTGSYFDYSIFAPEANPTFTTSEWDHAEHKEGLLFPRLYMTLFPPAHADSLAFIGPCRGHSIAACSNADLSSSAIAQVWKGNFSLPSQAEMESWCDENYKVSLKDMSNWRIQKTGHSSPGEFERWLNDVGGNELNERLGWGWKGWQFWWNEYKLYKLIMDGINTSHPYRLFPGREGGREPWAGARKAIYEANGKVYDEQES